MSGAYSRLLRLLSAMIMIALMLTAAVMAQAQVIVLGRISDVDAVLEHIHSDTTVIVLAGPKTEDLQALEARLAACGSPVVRTAGFKRMKNYTLAAVQKSWSVGSKGYAKLLADLRIYGDDEIFWYVPAEEPELKTGVSELLSAACRDANDPAVRGDTNRRQCGRSITRLTDLQSGSTRVIQESQWRASLEEAWQKTNDPVIPGEPALNAEGFLDAGSFVYKDENAGVWYYVDDSLRVTITRQIMKDGLKHVWYEADVRCREGSDALLHCERGVPGENAIDGRKIAANWVFAINSDYYQYRKDMHYPIGMIIRDGKVIYDRPLGDMGKKGGVPNLDNALLTRDGRLSVYPAGTISSQQALEEGAMDALSFGPIFVQDGRWSQINANYHSGHDPRMALGYLGPNHYLVVYAEGRIDASKGMSLDELQLLFLARGAVNAINLDGGRTACMCFMGERLGTVSKTGKTIFPRAQWEMLVVGRKAP